MTLQGDHQLYHFGVKKKKEKKKRNSKDGGQPPRRGLLIIHIIPILVSDIRIRVLDARDPSGDVANQSTMITLKRNFREVVLHSTYLTRTII